MKGKRQLITVLADRREPDRRGPLGVVAAMVLHVLGLALLVRIAVEPRVWDLFEAQTRERVKVEHIGFIAIPRPAEQPHQPARAGGDNRVDTGKPSLAPPALVTPTVVPSAIPEPTKTAPPTAAEGGSGPLVGGGGPTKGVRPSYADPRIWIPTGPVVRGPKSPTQRLDSAIMAGIQQLEDSLEKLPAGKKAGDWTVTRNGKKYGIDQGLIHLGNFSLPTALLALLPINAQANPVAMERDRRLSQIRGEILEQAAKMARDDEFRAAVKELRQRRERERAKKAADDAVAPVPVPIKP